MTRYHYGRSSYVRSRRLQEEGGTRWSVVIKTFLLLVIAVSLALFYVWQNVQLVRLGYKIKEKERAIVELTKRSKALEIDVSVLKMPSRIMSVIQREGLHLTMPEVGQIVRIQPEPILYEEDLVNEWGSDGLSTPALIRIMDKG